MLEDDANLSLSSRQVGQVPDWDAKLARTSRSEDLFDKQTR